MKKTLILLGLLSVFAFSQTPIAKGFSQKKTLTTFWSPLVFQYGKNSIKDFSVINIGSDTAKVAFNVYDTTTAPSVYSHIKLFSIGSVPIVYSASATTKIDTIWVKGTTTSAVIFINATYR